jgi:hypothetical protein
VDGSPALAAGQALPGLIGHKARNRVLVTTGSWWVTMIGMRRWGGAERRSSWVPGSRRGSGWLVSGGAGLPVRRSSRVGGFVAPEVSAWLKDRRARAADRVQADRATAIALDSQNTAGHDRS